MASLLAPTFGITAAKLIAKKPAGLLKRLATGALGIIKTVAGVPAKKPGAGVASIAAQAAPIVKTTPALAGAANTTLAQRARAAILQTARTGGGVLATGAGLAAGGALIERALGAPGVRAGGGRRHRRMNPLNPKALRRAIRRESGFRDFARQVMGPCHCRPLKEHHHHPHKHRRRLFGKK